jgi:hypothetical protein
MQLSLLQTVIPSLDEYARYYNRDRVGQDATKNKLRSIIGDVDCTFIAVRGDGLCLLNATCPVLYCSMQHMRHEQLLDATVGFHNISDVAQFIPTSHQLNAEVTSNCEVSLNLVKQNFKLITEQLLSRIGLPIAEVASVGFRPDINPQYDNYTLQQLGQVISTSLSCVIVNINIEESTTCTGIFPNGESLSLNEGSMTLDQIREYINNGTWRVVFNISRGRHYNAMIPKLSSDINESNIRLFNMIFRKIKFD